MFTFVAIGEGGGGLCWVHSHMARALSVPTSRGRSVLCGVFAD